MELEYTAQRIMRHGIRPVPDLPLVIVPDYLSKTLLRNIKSNWPTDNWRDNGSLNNNRRQFRLDSKIEFWRKVQLDFIESKTISYIIHSLFKQVPYYTHVLTDLWEDHEGYAVGQHTDNPRIDIFCQIYLAETAEQEKHGAKICTEQGDVVYQIPMQSNLCWIAKNTPDLHHRVDPYPLKIPRRSLMFRYMTN
jgi:hypothetical protein